MWVVVVGQNIQTFPMLRSHSFKDTIAGWFRRSDRESVMDIRVSQPLAAECGDDDDIFGGRTDTTHAH